MIKISTRLVFIFEKFVIKIPLSYRGFLQCKNEKFLYSKYKDLNLLGELYFEKLGIVCMKKYKSLKKIDTDQILNVKNQINELNIENCDLFNIKNWGIENGKIFLIDYGINEQISKMYK